MRKLPSKIARIMYCKLKSNIRTVNGKSSTLKIHIARNLIPRNTQRSIKFFLHLLVLGEGLPGNEATCILVLLALALFYEHNINKDVNSISRLFLSRE